MGTGHYINTLNQGSYTFDGTCIKDGGNSIECNVESSASFEETAPLTDSINCVDDAWGLPLTDIGSLPSGEISVSLSYSKFSASIAVTKNTVVPVLNSITYRQGRPFELACDGTSAYDDSYTYRWIANSSTSHTFAKDVAFSDIALNSLLDNVSSDGDQDIYLHMQVRDEAGNISGLVKSGTFRYDNTAPRITTVTGQSGNSVNTPYKKEGDTVTFSVSFSENVTASGTPVLNLGRGCTADCSNYTGGSKKILTFSYQVVSTDNGGLELRKFLFDSSEKIIDGGSNKIVELSAPIMVSGITLDTTALSMKNIVVTNNNNVWIWGWGCNEAVCQYRHTMDTSRASTALSGNYSTTATISPPKNNPTGTYCAHVQARDAAGNKLVALMSADSIPLEGVPVVKSFNGPDANTYSTGGTLDIQVIFDRSVVVTGTSQLPLRIGAQDKYANYTSGSDSNVLTFRYVVVDGDSDRDGDALGASGVTNLNEGGINGSTSASVAFSATSFTGVLVDTILSVMTITSTHTAEIKSGNVADYQVSGTCKAGVAVQVRVGVVAPVTVPICSDSETWTASLNVGKLDKGSAMITVSQTDSVGTGNATPVSVRLGDFEQMIITSSRIDVGSDHSCVIKFDGKVSCWGRNGVGQLGTNSTTDSLYPVDVRDHTGSVGTTLENIIQVSLGYQNTCAVNSGGKVLCWGNGSWWRLGNHSQNHQHYPRFVNGINNDGRLGGVVGVATGFFHSCAVGTNGQVSCWGSNSLHETGSSQRSHRSRFPRTVRTAENGPPLEGIVQAVVGGGLTYTLTSGGKVWCGGGTHRGALENGVSGGRSSREIYPVAVRDSSGVAESTLSDLIQISAGPVNSCALKADGSVYCWGYEVGGGATGSVDGSSSYPVATSSLANIKAISQSVGPASILVNTSCVLGVDGNANCWGDNRNRQLPKGVFLETDDIRTIKASLDDKTVLDGIVEIAAGNSNVCTLMATGKVKCWGHNENIAREGNAHTAYPVYVPSSLLNCNFTPGIRSSQYICRKSFSKCVRGSTFLAPGGGQFSYIMNGGSPVISIYGLNNGKSLTFFSDSTCTSALSGGSVSGASSSNPRTLTLSNTVTDQELSLYYKIGGHDEINSSLCFKSSITFDRKAPPAPTAVSFSGRVTLSSLLDRVNVAVTVNSKDSMKEYTEKVYFENSTCGDSNALITEGYYYRNVNFELRFDSSLNYPWNAYDNNPDAPPVQLQGFKFYSKVLDIAGNSSGCGKEGGDIAEKSLQSHPCRFIYNLIANVARIHE